MRQIVLDTETTGLDPKAGHRIIEIGCIELVDRRYTGRHYHQYIRPDRKIDRGAEYVHGITQAFLADKPSFPEVVEALLGFISGAELIIHNAPFDIGFLDYELALAKFKNKIEEHCAILDTLLLARKKHPGGRNSLDALCKRYGIDNTHRQYHGALLDAHILGDVYLAMTAGQTFLNFLDGLENKVTPLTSTVSSASLQEHRFLDLPVLQAGSEELAEHKAYLQKIQTVSGKCVWEKTTSKIGSS